MKKISNTEEFRAALGTLSDVQQRILGTKFLAEVLDLTQNTQLKALQAIAQKEDASADDLESAYHQARSIAMNLASLGVREIIDFKKQAEQYVAKGFEACLFPMPSEVKHPYRAWNVAHFCREARVCSDLKHESDTGILENVEKDLHATIARQYELTSIFMAKA